MYGPTAPAAGRLRAAALSRTVARNVTVLMVFNVHVRTTHTTSQKLARTVYSIKYCVRLEFRSHVCRKNPNDVDLDE